MPFVQQGLFEHAPLVLSDQHAASNGSNDHDGKHHAEKFILDAFAEFRCEHGAPPVVSSDRCDRQILRCRAVLE